ncbi:ComF family protein [Roseibium sp. RKSG952]|uniref:ComF family protein n=1 Tax=Roseibium sp. RKSG952 TaxID=2529384 RepID=UPI0034CF4AF0
MSPRAIAEPPLFDRARAVAIYSGKAREMVHRFKYGARRELAAPMARLMARAGQELFEDDCLLVPVPLHWTRRIERRFNQAADLAVELGRETGQPVLLQGLQRTRKTQRQVGLSGKDRIRNVRGAFAVSEAGRARVFGQRIVLVDDVLTTGSTVQTCVRVLRSAGAGQVDVLTFALADLTSASS